MVQLANRVSITGLMLVAASLAPAPLRAQAPGVWFSGTWHTVFNDDIPGTFGDYPFGVAPADFNGDGILDLATATCNSDNVTIFLGKGGGSLRPLTLNSYFRAAACPQWIVSGDFDRDGRIDLATANRGGGVSILLGYGNGTFRERTDIGLNTDQQSLYTGPVPEGIAAGDFDGDGLLELVTANRARDNVSILRGLPGGAFAFPVDFPTADWPVKVVVADFNGDHRQDVAVATWSQSRVSVLLGNGDGTLGDRLDIPTGEGPLFLDTGDFNGDGILDIVTANSGAGSASILRGKGDGTFPARTDVPTPPTPREVVAGDFNADGALDFITASERGGGCILCPGPLAFFAGKGDGTFTSALALGNATYPSGIAAVDLNADGRLDLAMAEGPGDEIAVLLQTARATLDPASLRFDLQPPGTASPTRIVSFQSSGSFPVLVTAATLAGADADQFRIVADECSSVAVSPGSGCRMAVAFGPTTAGPKSASLTFAGDAPGSPHTLRLFASPPDFALRAVCGGERCSGSRPAPVVAGDRTQFEINGTPEPAPPFVSPVDLQCTSLPPGATCSFAPGSTLDLSGGEQSVTLTIRSTRSLAQSVPRSRPRPESTVPALVLALAPLAFLRLRRSRQDGRPGATGLVVIALVTGSLFLSCTIFDNPPAPGTPPGTHTVVVSGHAGAVQRTVSLTMVIAGP